MQLSMSRGDKVSKIDAEYCEKETWWKRAVMAFEPRSPSAEWLLPYSETYWMVVFIFILVLFLLYLPVHNASEQHLLIVVCAVIFNSLPVIAIRMFKKRLSSWMVAKLIVATAIIINAATMAVILSSHASDRSSRERDLYRFQTLYKMMPCLGLQLPDAAMFILASWCIDVVTQYFAHVLFGDDFSALNLACGLGVTLIAASVSFLSIHRLGVLEAIESGLDNEQRALNGFMGHCCNGFVRVAEDGNRIIRCDACFEECVRSEGQGKTIDSFFKLREGSELVSDALQDVHASCITQLKCELRVTGDMQDVTLMVMKVDQQNTPGRRTQRNTGIRHVPYLGNGYLVGLRFDSDFNRHMPVMSTPNDTNRSLVSLTPGSRRLTSPVNSFPLSDDQKSGPSSIAFSRAKNNDFSALKTLGSEERWLIKSELNIFRSEILGEGGFGKVVKGTFHGTPVAVKLRKEAQAGLVSFLAELRWLRYLRHPNIVLFHGACLDEKNHEIALVFELVHGPTMSEIFCANQKQECGLPDIRGRMEVILGIALGLQYLHGQEPSIIHGDLQPSNILVEIWRDMLRAKIADFGLSQRSGDNLRQGCSPRYAPPELFTESELTVASDTFSLGRLIFFAMMAQKPLSHLSAEKILVNLQQKRVLPRLRWSRDSDEARAAEALELQCTDADASKRPRIADVVCQLWSLIQEADRSTSTH